MERNPLLKASSRHGSLSGRSEISPLMTGRPVSIALPIDPGLIEPPFSGQAEAFQKAVVVPR